MLVVASPEYGVLEVNYMWLPSWIGMNSVLLKEIGAHVSQAVVGKELPDALEAGHNAVLDFLEQRFPGVQGLRVYLDSLRSVALKDGG